jgi:H+/gluconate symporter-like permease
MGIAGIVIALGALIFLAYRGISVLVLAPLCAALASLMAGVPVLAGYTQIFMPALGGFAVSYFPLFLLGAVFGRLMDASGSARAIARGTVRALGAGRAIPAIVLACAILTYGGVSLFVVAFAVYPIAEALFREAEVPKRLIPGTIALGAFTFTMTALPGTPAIQNAIPMPHFGTTPFAAPGLGAIAGLVMAGLGLLWLERRFAAARAAGEGYGSHPEDLAEGEAGPLPPFALALAPVVLVVAFNYLFGERLIPALDTGYLARPLYDATTVETVRGIWAIIGALTLSCLAVILMHPRLPDLPGVIGRGAEASLLPIFNTASLVGFGAVVAALPAFDAIREAVLGLAPGNPLISLAVSVSLLAGITGSASGGMSIALDALGETYLAMGREAGIDPALLHRVTAIATGGLDALPHNGAVITLLSICRLGHREAYADIFVVAVLAPVLALVAVIALGTLLGSF